MPAALSHLKKINKCQLQYKHFPWSAVGISKQGREGLWGQQRKTTQESQLLEEARGKIMGEFFIEGKDRPTLGRSQLKEGTEPDSCPILPMEAPGGKHHLDIARSPWLLSSRLPGFLLQPKTPLSSSRVSQGHLQVWVQVLPSHPQAWGDALLLHTVS